MQLIPATARRFGVSNSFDVHENIEAGVKYLKYLLDLFGDERLAVAAYNAGDIPVLRTAMLPPYAETVDYVYRVGRRTMEARQNAPEAKPAPVRRRTRTAPATPGRDLLWTARVHLHEDTLRRRATDATLPSAQNRDAR